MDAIAAAMSEDLEDPGRDIRHETNALKGTSSYQSRSCSTLKALSRQSSATGGRNDRADAEHACERRAAQSVGKSHELGVERPVPIT
jgi:hypothetical protein